MADDPKPEGKDSMVPPGPLPERQTGSTPAPDPWGGLPQQVTQEETLERVNRRSPWL